MRLPYAALPHAESPPLVQQGGGLGDELETFARGRDLAFFGVVSRAYRSACLIMASALPESDPSKASESA